MFLTEFSAKIIIKYTEMKEEKDTPDICFLRGTGKIPFRKKRSVSVSFFNFFHLNMLYFSEKQVKYATKQ